jgi:GMP synthase (glutamine-hydrolysing)
MKIHWLQHVAFEGLGLISQWLEMQECEVSCTRLYRNEVLPAVQELDMLIVMGGPMGIYDEKEYPWLIEEKAFIRHCIAEKKVVLGVCLGAQLLADALGSTVQPNRCKEIGWFAIERQAGVPQYLQTLLPREITVLHWHGDTFALPAGAIPLYSSAACRNQAFIFNERLFGLQFHLETGDRELSSLVENCGDELGGGEWVQGSELLFAGVVNVEKCRTVLADLLEHLFSLVPARSEVKAAKKSSRA